MVTLTKDITIVRQGQTFDLKKGDRLNPDKWPGLKRLIEKGYNDKMERSGGTGHDK